MAVKKEAIGVDLGGTNIRVARISDDGNILERTIDKVPESRNAQLDMIFNCIKKLITSSSAGIGLGFPGRVRISDGMALTAGYLDLQHIPLAKIMTEELSLPVYVDTDANMALFSEYRIGNAQGYKNIAMLTIGTGIGGAIILDGQLFYGNGTAGQLGHVTVDMNGPLCNCGRRGCIETLSSGTALRGLLLKSGIQSNLPISELLDRALADDEQILILLTQWISPLKLAIDSITATLSPELILLGGGLGEAANDILKLIQPAGSPWFNCKVDAGILGDNAGIIGSGLCAIDMFTT